MKNYRHLDDVTAALQIEGLQIKQGITGFEIDSRAVRAGDLFFALPGQRADGHDFLNDVARKGACGAVVREDYRGKEPLPLIRVPSPLAALQNLARQKIQAMQARIVAVTGSVGKTTTKDFLSELLSSRYYIGKTLLNANTDIGLPLSILKFNGDEEFLVLEMGMAGKGQLNQLLSIAPPELAILTKIGFAHSAFFNSLDEIAQEKASLIQFPSVKEAIIHRDNYQFEVVSKSDKKKYKYALDDAQCDATLIGSDLFILGEERVHVDLPFDASHFKDNFVAAALAAYRLGVSLDEIAERAQNLRITSMRFELTEKFNLRMINDSYNANPLSMRAAFENLPSPQKGGRTLGVLGFMSPLGKFSAEQHLEIGKQALKVFDEVLCFGDECLPIIEQFESQNKPCSLFNDLEELRQAFFELAKPEDTVLIKGSNCNQLWRLLEDRQE